MMAEFQPYVGPKSFEEKDKDLFFGRDAEANDLFSLIVAHQVVLIYAQSGAGKTSLLNAKIIPSLKSKGYEVLPLARVQGLRTAEPSNIYVFNTLQSWANGQSEERGNLAGMSLTEFLKKRPHTQRLKDSPAIETNNGHPADTQEPDEEQEPWELPRIAVFDQFEELFTSYPHRWQEREAFFKQVREALDDDYLLRIVFLMREDYIAELDPYVSFLPGNLRVRTRLERLDKNGAFDAVVKPLQFTNRKFGEGVARTLVENLMKSSNGRPGVEQFVEAVQLQVVCQSLWQSLKPNDNVITLKHLQECGDVDQALMSFYEKSIRSIVGEKGLPDGKRQITEGELRRWFEKVLITPEKKRATVDRRAERTGDMPNDTVIRPLERVQLIKGEWRAGARWYELSHDRFIDPILTSNQKWLEEQSATEKIRQRLEARAIEFGRGAGGLLNEDELLEAKRLQAKQSITGLVSSEALSNLIQASRVPEQQRKIKLMSLGVSGLVIIVAVMAFLVLWALGQRAEARSKKSEADVERNKAVLASKQAEIRRKEAEEANDKFRRAEAEAKKERDVAQKQRLAAEKAKVEARNAENRAKQESKVASKFGAEAIERTLVAEGEKLIERNKDLTKGGLLVIAAAEMDRRLEAGKPIQTSELKAWREKATAAEETSLVNQSGEGSLRHRAREVVRNMLANLNRRPEVIRPNDTAEVRSAVISPDSNYFIIITKVSNRQITEDEQEPDTTLWSVLREEKQTTGIAGPSLQVRKLYAFKGHDGPILSAAFSSDSKYILTTGADSAARVWDRAEGKELKVLRQHELPISRGAFVPNNNEMVLTISEDRTARLWNWRLPIDSTNPIVLSGHGGGVHDFTFDRDGNYLVTEAADNTGRLWNLKDIKKNPQNPTSVILEGLRGPDAAVAFNQNGDKLVTEGRLLGYGEYVAIVWDVNKIWDRLATAPKEQRRVNPESASAIPGEVHLLRGHRDKLTGVSFSPKGEVLTASADKTARIWNADSGVLIAELRGHTGPVQSAKADRNGEYVITAALDKTARLWDIKGNSIATLRGHTGGLVGANFSPDGRLIVTASTDGTVRVWNAPSEYGLPERGVTELDGHTAAVFSVMFSPDIDSKELLTGSLDSTARLWDRQTGQPKDSDFRSAMKGVFNREGNLIATGGLNYLRVYKRTDSRWVLSSEMQLSTNFHSIAFSPDSSQIVTVGRKSPTTVVQVWERQGGKLTEPHPLPHQNFVLSAEFNPTDGTRIVTACWDGVARLWNKSASGDWSLGPELKHGNPILSATFSPNGNYIVTGGYDGVTRVWKQTAVDKWEPVELRGHTGPVYSAVFSPDGESIVTASGDKTAGVWKKVGDNKWKLVSILSDQEGIVFGAAFSADGQFIATASEDGKAHVYSKVMFEPFEDVLTEAIKLKPYLCGAQGGQSLSVFCENVISGGRSIQMRRR